MKSVWPAVGVSLLLVVVHVVIGHLPGVTGGLLAIAFIAGERNERRGQGSAAAMSAFRANPAYQEALARAKHGDQ